MKVKQLAKILRKLDQEAVIDLSSDEEGNQFGDISDELSEGRLKSGDRVYSLYPESGQLPEERYQ